MNQDSASGKCGQEQPSSQGSKKERLHPRPEWDPSLDEKENIESFNSSKVKRLKLEKEFKEVDDEVICLKEREEQYQQK